MSRVSAVKACRASYPIGLDCLIHLCDFFSGSTSCLLLSVHVHHQCLGLWQIVPYGGFSSDDAEILYMRAFDTVLLGRPVVVASFCGARGPRQSCDLPSSAQSNRSSTVQKPKRLSLRVPGLHYSVSTVQGLSLLSVFYTVLLSVTPWSPHTVNLVSALAS